MVEPTGRLAPPCVLVIFGAAGDLTKRLLLPTVVNLVEHGLVGPAPCHCRRDAPAVDAR